MSANGTANGHKKTLIKTKPRIENNRVLVTGGAGFVGSHLCTYLVEKGDHVRLLGAQRQLYPPDATHQNPA